MNLWMSAELMHECAYANTDIRNEIVPRINELIQECTLGNYIEWAVITIILNEHGPDNYNEIVRRSLKNKVLEFRLKIDYEEFMKGDYKKKKKLVLEMLLSSLDLMSKWKDIKQEERELIKNIIKNEYKDILS